MNTADFNDVVNTQIEHSTSVLIKKADEYASETDRLANFKVAGNLQGITQAQALAGMMAKHTQSVYAMIASGQEYTEEMWDEKIGDHINYLLLLRAVKAEDGFKVNPNAVQAAPTVYVEKPDMVQSPRVIIDSEDHAYQVLDRMNELISQYGVATVGDFNDLIGVDSVYKDNLFGWDRTISVATVTKVVEVNGYELHIPPAGPLPEFFEKEGAKFGKQAAQKRNYNDVYGGAFKSFIEPSEVPAKGPNSSFVYSGRTTELPYEVYKKFQEDQTALDKIARILSDSNDWGSQQMSDVFQVLNKVRSVNTGLDPLDISSAHPDAIQISEDLYEVSRDRWEKANADETALNDIARVLATSETVYEEGPAILDIVQRVRVVEEDQS